MDYSWKRNRKKGVHEFLTSHPQVSRYEQAPQGDGGGGATIVYLN
jgi:DNA mismatch repair protein MutS2